MDPAGVTVLRTGGDSPLLTSVLRLQIPDNATHRELYFEFGFGTDEVLVPGTFLDSFTVTLQGADLANTLILLTADSSGVVWAPVAPGGVILPPDSFVFTPEAFPRLEPSLASQMAFGVTLELPTAFAGEVNMYFDLFDNLNTTHSLGWHRAVIVVPEPGTWGLLALCVGALMLHRHRVARGASALAHEEGGK